MKSTVRRYLRTVGSVLDIDSSTDYSSLIKKPGDQESLSGDFLGIGDDFCRAIALGRQ